MERQAFHELEQAMISASMPKRERLLIIQEMSHEKGGAGVLNGS